MIRPRHYLLIAFIIGLFIFNLWRRNHPAAITPKPTPVVTTAPPVQTPAWSAFDHAASLRDAGNDTFDPAMQALNQAIASATDPSVSDIKGCLTWLQFYRQGVNHPSKDTTWKDRSSSHLNGCTKYHLDTTS
jgi:hypothetical protein